MKRSHLGLAVLLVAATGCGDGAPPLAAVSGRVTVDGKPLAGKSVRYFPEAGSPGQGAGGITDIDGRYSLIAVRPGATSDFAGVPPGAYRVVVTEPMFPVNLPEPAPEKGVPAPAIGLPKAQPKNVRPAIPPLYSDQEKTPLRFDVPAEGKVIDIELSSKPDKK